MQNEKGYKNHYNQFLNILDFDKVFKKIVYAILVLGILNNNMCLSLIDLNRFLLLISLFH